jgi:hypothetical protein
VAEIFVWNGGGQGKGKLDGISWPGRLGGEGNKEGGPIGCGCERGEGSHLGRGLVTRWGTGGRQCTGIAEVGGGQAMWVEELDADRWAL